MLHHADGAAATATTRSWPSTTSSTTTAGCRHTQHDQLTSYPVTGYIAVRLRPTRPASLRIASLGCGVVDEQRRRPKLGVRHQSASLVTISHMGNTVRTYQRVSDCNRRAPRSSASADGRLGS